MPAEVQNMSVIVDPGMPTNLGSGSSEDYVIACRSQDLALWKSPLHFAVRKATYANSMSVLITAWWYVAFCARYATSVAVIGPLPDPTPGS
jgi:hypothetical protein